MLKLARWGGLAAMVGGALFGVLAVVIASLPGGCIGEGCEFSQMKNTGFAVPLLMLALLFIAAGAAALVVHAQQAGRLGRLGGVGAVIGTVGLALLVIGVVTGGLIEAFFFAGDFPLMPLFVLPGGSSCSPACCCWSSLFCGRMYCRAGRRCYSSWAC